MKSYKDPSFQDRVGRAAAAKQAALDRLKARPPVDEAVLAERREAAVAREADKATARADKRAAEDQAKTERDAAAASSAPAAAPLETTEAERKAARDARYAARKRRK